MPNVKGTIESFGNPPNRFDATFSINGQRYTYSANISINLVRFNGDEVVLNYKTEADLYGRQTYNGTIGANKIDITLGNGPTIQGPIVGGPGDIYNINGSGNWLKTES